MKKLLLLLFATTFFHTLIAQPTPEKYHFIAQIKKEAESGALRFERVIELYAYIGAYKLALEADKTETSGFGLEKELSKQEVIYFNHFKPINAKEYIIKRARREQIILLNEAHHKPLHRVFLESLLDSLYAGGYRYLGLEALTPFTPFAADTTLNQRGYPYNSFVTGNYTREPQFGNLIRKAIKLGFEVFPYEASPAQKKYRDSAQALNAGAILARDPNAKIVMLCGYGHLLEKTPSNYPYPQLGYYLKQITGIDPFTINQEVLTERAATSENPYYKLMKAKKPTVFVNKKGKAFNGTEGLDLFDVMVYHPRTKYVQGRPNWLSRNGKFKYYTLKSPDIKIDCSCQIRAYYEKEPEAATPADIIEIATKDEQKALVLLPGNYNVVLENESGAVQHLKISVK